MLVRLQIAVSCKSTKFGPLEAGINSGLTAKNPKLKAVHNIRMRTILNICNSKFCFEFMNQKSRRARHSGSLIRIAMECVDGPFTPKSKMSNVFAQLHHLATDKFKIVLVRFQSIHTVNIFAGNLYIVFKCFTCYRVNFLISLTTG